MLVTMIATVLQELLLSLLLVPLVLNQYQLPWATGQMLSNRPPHFISGSGDMARFSLSENTPVDSPVYQLKAADPDGGMVRYSISGPVFSVDRDTGLVRLRQELDREKQNSVEVIISITDESILGMEPNTVSLRRVINVRDYNDNAPQFIGRPYSSTVSEDAPIGSVIEVSPNIMATDPDEGKNAEITLSCASTHDDYDEICETFDVATDRISDGNFTAIITLLKALDYESRSSYILTLMAVDGAKTNPLSSIATISINIVDKQDQAPVFLNAPYSVTLEENLPDNQPILTIYSMDGDVGNPRPITLSLENEPKGFFKLDQLSTNATAKLYTTNIPIDREDLDIYQNGGVYTFNIRATEMINGNVPADYSTTQVSVVITDIDDNMPEFNEQHFEIDVPENLDRGTPLPGLSIYVVDPDLGENSIYNLSLRNVLNAENVFEVNPSYGRGRTAVTVKVLDPSKLDFDVDNEDLRVLKFELIASVSDDRFTRSSVTVYLQDINDNGPVFEHLNYEFNVTEMAEIGTKITNLTATDKDSGQYGKINYVLKGFGSENFRTDKFSGGLYVKKSLDYEIQKSYSLSIVAIDGDGWETNANILIYIIDENDNAPVFESAEYTRTIREGATEFEPQFYVHAIDVDGPKQGSGKVSYSIDTENTINHVFSVDAETGEIKIERPVSSVDTERGQYDLSVVATDYGTPSLKNTTRVLVRVGISGNQRPIFKKRYNSIETGNNMSGPARYKISIPENTAMGSNITQITASDPDGLDILLSYRIVGANDNFVIDEQTGVVSVSTVARLDRDTNPHEYSLVINAVDAGYPISETGTATLLIQIDDVNDKPPKFVQASYTSYVSERTQAGSEILQITAIDTDVDAKLVYSIINPIKAASKTGIPLTSIASYDYRSAFRIESTTGKIFVNHTLNHDLAAEIMLTVQVIDGNAVYNMDKQWAKTEVIIFVQSFVDTNPIFKNKGWISSNPIIKVTVKEEMPIGSTLFKLIAEDPVLEQKITHFEIVEADRYEMFSLNEKTGAVLLDRRLDYEALNDTTIQFTVKAISMDMKRVSVSKVKVAIENVNDNSPDFENRIYRAALKENIKYPEIVLNVHARDADLELTQQDRDFGYNRVKYSLSGSNAVHFIINEDTGLIQIAPNVTIDREKTAEMRFTVMAEDAIGKSTEIRRSTCEVIVTILDENDNAPMFSQKSYSAVIPENAASDTFVFNISASDADDGPGGEVFYDFLNEGEANGLLQINTKTGEIRTKAALTGKGRSEPYDMIVRAQDNGAKVDKQKSLFSDVPFVLFIGDVISNYAPFFIAPKLGQIANITENATIASHVFQVIASDPDNPAKPNGILTYRIQDGIEDASAFSIDPLTGLITTLKPLDREAKAVYKIIIEVSDSGQPPQSATRVLRINVLDIDDHQPRFGRELEAQPYEISILEEQPAGTIVGYLQAIDEDIDENGAIDYMIIDGNEENLFTIERTANNTAIIRSLIQFDRETVSSYTLTIKSFKFGIPKSAIAYKSYNSKDLSEIEVLIKIIDIDDHLPEFVDNNPSFGVRMNIPTDSALISVRATDNDIDATPLFYQIVNVTFVPQFYKRDNSSIGSVKDIFAMNNATAEMRTAKSVADFVDGYFEVMVRVNNVDDVQRARHNQVKIYVIRDKSLLRFVFGKPPTEVKEYVDEFEMAVQERLKTSELELNILDTKVLAKSDQTIDFSSTSSCFQLSRHGSVIPPNEMQIIMNSEEMKQTLTDLFEKYSVSTIDSCSVRRTMTAASVIASTGTWLVVLSAVIGIFALVATCSACCLANKYKGQSSKLLSSNRTPPESSAPGTSILYNDPVYGPI